ncbi:MAG: hypothetical protein Q9M11_04610, partial [Mariprofundaceae bacterium]|nr:hypothetical protein [Mariprofundaceae bacterium]
SLNEAQHRQASEMLALAEQRQTDIEHWQQELARAITSYHITPVSSHNLLLDWLPNEGRLAGISTWASQQFHVQKANNQDHEHMMMRQQLQTIQHTMDLEQWPKARLWTSLRSRLQLHMLHDDVSHQALTLPEDFSPIQADIELLQQTARTWLKEY